MTTDYVGAVLGRVRASPVAEDAIRDLIGDVTASLESIDNDIQELHSQRAKLITLMSSYANVYRVLTGEELMSEEDLIRYEAPVGGDDAEANNARNLVLRVAAILADAIGDEDRAGITDDEILALMRENYPGTSIPWRNPKAVISTILSRSGEWKRTAPGTFESLQG